jgi:hypothetical protein
MYLYVTIILMGNQSNLSPAILIIAYIIITLHTGCKVDENVSILGESCS